MPDDAPHRPRVTRQTQTAPRFTALRTLATYYQWMGILAGFITALLCIVQLLVVARNEVMLVPGLITLCITAATGALVVLGLFAFAEHIKLMLQIELNTRETADVLTDLVTTLQADR